MYDFKNKSVKKINEQTKKIRYVIVEGIFGKKILESQSSNNCILVKLKTNKQSCMKRVIKRDFLERGKSKNLAQRDFIKAWEFFYNDKKENNSRNYLKEIVVINKRDINSLLKYLTKVLN